MPADNIPRGRNWLGYAGGYPPGHYFPSVFHPDAVTDPASPANRPASDATATGIKARYRSNAPADNIPRGRDWPGFAGGYPPGHYFPSAFFLTQ